MATVFLASADGHEGFQKLIALKVMHDHLTSDRAFVEMFLNEARVAARIEHANVCSVFDFGEADGTYFIAMEYLAGLTLASVRDEVRRRPYDCAWPTMAASLVAQACEGLHAAHNLASARGVSVGLVHRDVSPQNLFLTFTGTVKIVDFGIAHGADAPPPAAPGSLQGKFGYLAPEQLRQSGAVDRRADVWALGVTLWELLALRPLFRRSSPSITLASVMNEAIPAPSATQPLVPVGLDTIVAKALNRDVAQRYRTTRDMGRDLSAFCKSVGAYAGPCEIDEWLEALLPNERVRRGAETLAAPVDDALELEPQRTSDPSTVTMPAGVVPTELLATSTTAVVARPRRNRSRRLLATATLLLIGMGVGALVATSRTSAVSITEARGR